VKESNNQTIIHSACTVIVAHPDDETLWTGGSILLNPNNEWTIVSLCRKSDPDRNPKFLKVLDLYRATGAMGDLDDSPEQMPLPAEEVQETILSLLPKKKYDYVLTHSTQGEYTRHRRHEETAEAVVNLLQSGRLQAKQLWMFAYEDGNRSYTPKAITGADIAVPLPIPIWEQKQKIITETYGFDPESWEARTTPQTEAFWCFQSAQNVRESIRERSSQS